jgi:hypothetical protein
VKHSNRQRSLFVLQRRAMKRALRQLTRFAAYTCVREVHPYLAAALKASFGFIEASE